jgi:hypothetical protein
MTNHTKMDSSQWDQVNRKLSVYDIELGNKDVVLRLDLDVPLSPFVPPPKLLDMLSRHSHDHAAAPSHGKESKHKGKQSE